MGLEVQPERLFIAAEVRPCGVIDRHVGLSADVIRLGLVAVEREHLGHLCVDAVGRVVTDGQIFGIEELPDAKVTAAVGENVDGLDGRGVVGRPFNVHLNGELRCSLNHTRDGVEPVDMPGEDGRRLCVQPEVVGQVERDEGGRFVIGIEDAVVVVIPIRGQFRVFRVVVIRVNPRVVIVVVIDGVGPGSSVVGVGHGLAVTEVVVVPGVGGVSVEARGPKNHFVFVVHAVFIVVLVNVVACSVVVVVEGCRDVLKQFNGVGDTVAVPVVVGPVDQTVVVVIPRGLLFAPETSGQEFLVNVQTSIVIVVRIFAIRDAVVVVVNVVNAGLTEALRHDAAVPNGLEEAVIISVSIVPVVVVIGTIVAGEEVPVVLAGVVVKVEVAVDFKEVPNAVIVIVHVVPIVDGVVIVIEVDGGVGEVAVNVAVNIVLEQVCAQLVGEVSLGAVIAVPLPNAGGEANPGVEGVAVVLHLRER